MTTSSETFLKFAEGLLARRDLPAAMAAFDAAELAGAPSDECAGGRSGKTHAGRQFCCRLG